MPNITRCPNCATFIYDDARRCHGCGARFRRRRTMSLWSWLAVVLAVSAFGIVRSERLTSHRMDLGRRAAESARAQETARLFLEDWLTGEDSQLAAAWRREPKFIRRAIDLRDGHCGVLPAERLLSLSVEARGRQEHCRWDREDVRHEELMAPGMEPSGNHELATAFGADLPVNGSVMTGGGRNRGHTRTTWTTDRCEFQARVSTCDGVHEVTGEVCLSSDGNPVCIDIWDVHPADGASSLAAEDSAVEKASLGIERAAGPVKSR